MVVLQFGSGQFAAKEFRFQITGLAGNCFVTILFSYLCSKYSVYFVCGIFGDLSKCVGRNTGLQLTASCMAHGMHLNFAWKCMANEESWCRQSKRG